jgi:2-polyprenyl-6-methoxyphenol hydroxylase-like FAD-dependent oxidoreductase
MMATNTFPPQCRKRLKTLTFNDSENTVTAHFDDDTLETGNMVLGCDGSKSKVREFVVGTEAAKQEELDLTMINFAGGKYTAEQAVRNRQFHPIIKLCHHPEFAGTSALAGGFTGLVALNSPAL